MKARIERARAVSGIVFFLCWLAADASALSLRLEPGSGVLDLGDPLSVDLVVDDLSPEVIGAFQVGIDFDPAVLDYQGASSDDSLGVPGLQTVFGGSESPGNANVFEVSFLSQAQLSAIQGDSLVLATLSFVGVGAGESALSFSQTDLSDAFARPLAIDERVGATVTVNDPIPQPGAALLFAVGAAVLAASRRSARGNAGA
ncbi:MAG: cohesin domain-containing protein [Myxococcota bacterium]